MTVRILKGDCREVLRSLPDESVHCCVTSPPYFGLRDYGVAGQIGLEQTPAAFVAEMVAVFSEVRRVLKDDGTLWLNLGDSYAGSGKGGNPGHSEHIKQKTNAGSLGVRDRVQDTPGLKAKDLIGAPWRVALALQADGWYLRQDIIWSKPNPMPESIKDRCTKAHEYVFLMSKSSRYYFDADAIAETSKYSGLTGQDASGFKDPKNYAGKHGQRARHGKQLTWTERKAMGEGPRRGFSQNGPSNIGANQESRNKRSVWEIPTAPFSEAHFATFPPALIEPCILAGCPKGGTVLDPFGGAGTTGMVADRLGRDAILIELNPEYAAMAERRIKSDAGMFAAVC